MMTQETKKEVVLVTGSSGCLGQHIVKLLQEHDPNVVEIRCYDKVPYVNKLGHAQKKKMVFIQGDIRRQDILSDACEGVDCVIHTACVTDLSVVPDEVKMFEINVDGTKNVIEACIAHNVPRLIFASSSDMVCGTEHIFYGTESTTPIPSSWMIGKYGESKFLAEDLVISAAGEKCADGKTILRTISLRPTPFYGEQDKNFFYRILHYAKKMDGTHYRVRSLDERMQITYVGNVAWAFLRAKDRLAVDQTLSGEAFFITDDTPIIDVHEHVQPYVEAKGMRMSSFVIPYWIAWIFLSLLCYFIKIGNIFYKFDLDVPSVNMLNYMCSTFFYNRSKATLRLDYQPVYTLEEAKENSLPYYANVEIS